MVFLSTTLVENDGQQLVGLMDFYMNVMMDLTGASLHTVPTIGHLANLRH